MSEQANGQRQRSIPLHYWLVLLLLAGGGIYYTLSKQPHFVNPKIAAKPYVWPKGCERKEYKTGYYISESCMVAAYAIPQWKRYGWHVGMAGIKTFEGFYRVGNDAVAFRLCYNSTFFHDQNHKKDMCKASTVIDDTFVVSGESK